MSTIFQCALEAVTQAIGEAQKLQVGNAVYDTKPDLSPVTAADYAVQAVVSRTLKAAFPDIPIVAEEDSDDLSGALLQTVSQALEASPEDVKTWVRSGNGKPSQRFWTLDPIDGTKGFLRGEQYAIALALIEDGKVEMGLLGCPNLSLTGHPAPTLLWARRGEGTWSGQTRLKVSPEQRPSQLRVLRSVESGHTDPEAIVQFHQRLDIQAEPVRMDSQAKYAALAAAEGDVYLRLPSRPDYREKIWDQAAGSILVEEAGGRVTDVTGKPLDFSHGHRLEKNLGVVASNGPLHQQVIDTLAQVL